MLQMINVGKRIFNNCAFDSMLVCPLSGQQVSFLHVDNDIIHYLITFAQILRHKFRGVLLSRSRTTFFSLKTIGGKVSYEFDNLRMTVSPYPGKLKKVLNS